MRRHSYLGVGTEPSGPPAWKTIPSWYLVGTVDNAIPPAQQRVMAQRAGSTTVEAGHLSMLSHSGSGVIGGEGWEEVADYALEWATEHATTRPID